MMKALRQAADSPDPAVLERPHCARCGATIRRPNGLCLRCSLREGLQGPGAASRERFEATLTEDEVPDQQWWLGNYQVLEEIGRGGMGIIYRARQRHSQRVVALKRVFAHQAGAGETLERFRREAKAAARLDHPNILPVYEVSESEDGLPFFSMKYATGGSLRAAAPDLRERPDECVRLMAKVARAIEFAHAQGILHRDLQPGNVLLDARGEPLVSDFGLAKWLDEESDLTVTLTIFGTPGYIAPEQAEDSGHGPAADIYSLGAILFYLLAGQPPFVGANTLAVIRQAASKAPPKLRALAPAIDRGLETIVARCLERDPTARYRSAGDLAADLERWVEGEPIVARPVRLPAQMWRWSRRNPLLAGTLAVSISLGAAFFFAVERDHVPTTDLAAHKLYLRGIALQSEPVIKTNLEQAAKCFEQAIARDPQFLQAYWALAQLHLTLFEREAHTPERLQKANAVIARAAQIQPDAGELHLVRARYLSRGLGDYEAAQQELELARRALPNDSGIHFELALLNRRQARWREALRDFDRALALDPQNSDLLINAATAFSQARHYEKATQLARRALALVPDKRELRLFLAMQPMAERADLSLLRSELEGILAEELIPGSADPDQLMTCALRLRDSQIAERALALIPAEGYRGFRGLVVPREWYAASIAHTFGRWQSAREAFTATRSKLEEHLRQHPNDALAWSFFGQTLAGLGEKEKAIAASQRACELWPLSKEPIWGLKTRRFLAVIYAWTGEKARALQELREHAGQPLFVDYGDLKLDPDWDRLRDDPEFERIGELLRPK